MPVRIKDTPGQMRAWSFSKLSEFEKCKYRTWLLHVARVAEPERPLPPGKTEHANDRGTRIHSDIEHFIKGERPDPGPEASKHFLTDLTQLRQMYAEGRVSVEGEWGMDEQWNPCPWPQAWLRLKLDAMALRGEGTQEAAVVDFKTGKKFGNEIKHNQQLQLYQLVTFLRHPELQLVHAELWYIDTGEITSRSYTRDQGLRFLGHIDRQARQLMSCTDWPANPSLYTCRWCMYGPWGSGDCPAGVKK